MLFYGLTYRLMHIRCNRFFFYIHDKKFIHSIDIFYKFKINMILNINKNYSKLLISLTVQYFKSEESIGERSTCIVTGLTYLLIAMIILIIDENTLEIGLEQAYKSFNESASVYLEDRGVTSTWVYLGSTFFYIYKPKHYIYSTHFYFTEGQLQRSLSNLPLPFPAVYLGPYLRSPVYEWPECNGIHWNIAKRISLCNCCWTSVLCCHSFWLFCG